MIFDFVVLNNFGPYRGAHRIDLAVTKQRPVVLVGALNGSGKTTFLDGMQLALYGKNARCSGRERTNYPDYLESMINRDAPPQQGASVEFAFRARSSGHDTHLRLVRTWAVRNSNVKETLEVYRDGVMDEVAAERWIEFVEDFMPAQIADLFFFDGEKIEALADPQKSAALLKEGVHSLLGIDLVESLLTSLQQIERKRKIDTVSANDKEALYAIETQRNEMEAAINVLAQRRGTAQNDCDKIGKRESLAMAEFKRLGGDLLSQRETLTARQVALVQQKQTLEEELRSIAASALPLLVAPSMVKRAMDQAAAAQRAQQIDLLRDEAAARDQATLNFLQSLDQQGAIKQQLMVYLHQDRQERYAAPASVTAMPAGLLRQMASVDHSIIQATAQRLVQEIDRCEENLVSVERNLAAVPPEALVAKIQAELEVCRSDRARIDAMLVLIDDEMGTLRYKLDRLKGQLDREAERLGEKLTRDETSKRVIAHSGRARATLAQFREALLSENLHRLEATIQARFQTLMRKRTLIQTISIDPSTFQIAITNDAGQLIPSSRLSAGERQLLAVATLWGLAQESGRRLPTVIDTPLSRLDSRHRAALIKHYFPKASHQVILLSTDEEVVGQYHLDLERYIGRTYMIENDEKQRTSRFAPGYFEMMSDRELA